MVLTLLRRKRLPMWVSERLLINGKTVEMNPHDSQILSDWINAGQLLGSHTYSHLDLAKVSSSEFITDIRKNEPLLKSDMGERNFHYFRYPYLSEGNTQEKRDTVRKFLFDNNYKISTVTVDFFEYEWNAPYVRCVAKNDVNAIAWLKTSYIEQALNALIISHELSMMLYKRDIKNVLLIHINAFTTEMLDELLTAVSRVSKPRVNSEQYAYDYPRPSSHIRREYADFYSR
jgi:peptidoglycan/xylan/chitin deacetylase (PgdA/CDA1 family)